jgi:hypothetical protein
MNKKVYSCRPVSLRALGVKPGKSRIIAARSLTPVVMNNCGPSLVVVDAATRTLEWCGADCSVSVIAEAGPARLSADCPKTPAVMEFFGLTEKPAPKKAAPKAEVKEEVAPKVETTEEAPAPKKTTKKKASKKASTKKAAAEKEEAPVEEAKPEVAPEEPKAEEPKDFDPFA